MKDILSREPGGHLPVLRDRSDRLRSRRRRARTDGLDGGGLAGTIGTSRQLFAVADRIFVGVLLVCQEIEQVTLYPVGERGHPHAEQANPCP